MRTRGAPDGARAYTDARSRRKKRLAAVVCMAAMVVFCTVYALMMPAATLESTTCCGETEHTHTSDCYESVLSCGMEEGDVHIHDESCYDETLVCETSEHTHTDECYVNPEATEEAETETAAALPDGAEVPEGYTEQYTVQDEDSGFTVTVCAPEGVVPEGATLSAALLSEDDDAYAAAEEALAEDAEEDSGYGFAALDIHFEDAEGNEVEPEGDVYVVIDAADLLPEDVDADTVTVQHHGESDGTVTVETVADAAEETDGVVAVTEESVVQAAFTVESFSTFTITWSSSYSNSSLTVQIIDTYGNPLGTGSLGSATISSATSISDIVKGIEEQVDGTLNNYTFSKAVAASNSSSATSSYTQVYYIRRSVSNWQYSTSSSGSSWSSIESNNIYLIYSTSLTTVETVDSTSEGVHMYMFDYSSAAFSGASYGTNSGALKRGIASSTVNSTTGWPSLTGEYDTPSGTSFSTFFGGTTSAYDLSGISTNSLISSAQEVNHLFLKSYYDEDGTFYYSSFENFATLKNDNDSDFTVYEQLGSPNASTGSGYYFYQRGNFFPYNTLNLSNIINYNLYDYLGQSLENTDARYNEPIYGFNESNNYYFGMYIWADFYQPEDGQVESNTANEDGTVDTSDMVFEFTGDDDMWVYIDGVLVLDLGGIHDAQSGYINFATGVVGYTDTTSGASESWNYTNLKEIFTTAGVATSYDWDGNTFKDGSSHRIQIFYMERGAGASNLKISFNLKTIPDGQLAVTKDVENYYAPQISDVTYTMRVEVYDEEQGKWVAYADQAYTLMGDESTTYYTDSSGQFTIKNDETALFPDIDVDTKVRVSEVGSSDTSTGATISQNYTIDYTITDSGGSTISGSTTDDGYATASMPAYGSINVTVTNTATYTRPLQLVKIFSGTEDGEAPEDFEATYTLYEQVTNSETSETEWQAVGSIKYSDMSDGTYTFWLDVDKTYKIVETFETGDNKGNTEELVWSSVTVITNDPASGTNAGDGIVYLETSDATSGDDVDSITMTNVYTGVTEEVTIKKTDSDGTTTLLGANFQLYYIETTESDEGTTSSSTTETKYYYQEVTTGEGDNAVTTVKWISEDEITDTKQPTTLTSGSDGLLTFQKLDILKTYYLVETKAPDGYQLLTDTISISWNNGELVAYKGTTALTDAFIDQDTNTITVTNTTGAELPATGGAGTIPLTISGAMLIAAAVGGGYMLRRRRRGEGN